ncbi:C-type lectin 37Db [Drosophila eugracilis]|uniref:C-type lectin 37Db n=1 Tax=Drosophila eugracilis TaxID=29029 RepID=UPI0007E82994|nr:C-type lectin 37Db [Drosophila eugracilis]
MLRTAVVLFCFLLASNSMISECKVEDLVTQCGAFCFRSLWPVLDHISSHHGPGSNGSDLNQEELRQRLDTVEKQLAAQQQTISNLMLAPAKKAKEIPKIFQKIGTGFYYIEQIKKMNWFAAGEYCRRIGGHLASIQNDDELNAITDKLPSSADFWIDINDLADTNTYVSSTSGNKANYINWGVDQPTNDDEHCVLINELMFDRGCFHFQHFICQAGDDNE